MIILFFLAQRVFVEGVTLTGVKVARTHRTACSEASSNAGARRPTPAPTVPVRLERELQDAERIRLSRDEVVGPRTAGRA